jgi:hypothetical protein
LTEYEKDAIKNAKERQVLEAKEANERVNLAAQETMTFGKILETDTAKLQFLEENKDFLDEANLAKLNEIKDAIKKNTMKYNDAVQKYDLETKLMEKEANEANVSCNPSKKHELNTQEQTQEQVQEVQAFKTDVLVAIETKKATTAAQDTVKFGEPLNLKRQQLKIIQDALLELLHLDKYTETKEIVEKQITELKKEIEILDADYNNAVERLEQNKSAINQLRPPSKTRTGWFGFGGDKFPAYRPTQMSKTRIGELNALKKKFINDARELQKDEYIRGLNDLQNMYNKENKLFYKIRKLEMDLPKTEQEKQDLQRFRKKYDALRIEEKQKKENGLPFPYPESRNANAPMY